MTIIPREMIQLYLVKIIFIVFDFNYLSQAL